MSYKHKQVVLDASTLILLAKIDLLPLTLGRLRIVITTQVEDEATRRPDLEDARLIARLLERQRIRVRSVDPKQVKHLEKDFRLDLGEASSVVLAKELDAVLGTDDAVAIKACKILDIPFVTAIHLLIRAYEEKLIGRQQALVKLEKLQRYGRYDSRILEDAVKHLQGGQTP